MIVGVGTDIIEISRIQKAISSETFLKKCFTEGEIRQAEGRDAYFAGNFAVKESVSKCFGTGISGMELADIEVLRDDRGKPYVRLYGAAKKMLDDMDQAHIEVSISDTKDVAIAYAVLEDRS